MHISCKYPSKCTCTYSFFLWHFHSSFISSVWNLSLPLSEDRIEHLWTFKILGYNPHHVMVLKNWIYGVRNKQKHVCSHNTSDFFVKETQWSRHPSKRFLSSHSSISHSFRKSKIHLTVTTCRSLQITYSYFMLNILVGLLPAEHRHFTRRHSITYISYCFAKKLYSWPLK